jgi:predicted transcriptional regulator
VIALEALGELSRKGWADIRRSANVHEIAELAGHSIMSVALEMKNAVKGGYAEEAGPRTYTKTWMITDKGESYLAGLRKATR